MKRAIALVQACALLCVAAIPALPAERAQPARLSAPSVLVPGPAAPSAARPPAVESLLRHGPQAAAQALEAQEAPVDAQAAADASPLGELDSIVVSAGSVRGFLQDPALIDRYYAAAADYYGGRGKFPRVSYDAVLGQLREMVAKVPALEGRLWETDDLGEPFAIHSEVRTSGRLLSSSHWAAYLKEWSATLARQAAPIEEAADPKARLGQILDDFDAKTAAFEEALKGKSGKEQSRLRARFEEDLRADAGLKAAGAHLLLAMLQTESISDLLRSGDADLVLDALRRLRSPESLDWTAVAPRPTPLLDSVRALMPREDQLLADTVMFPVELRKTRNGAAPAGRGKTATYQFRPAPRRFHTIFGGLFIKECVGGDPGNLKQLTPRRWAVNALAKSQFHFVESEGKFRGVTRGLPRKGPDGAVYAAYDFLVPDLRRKTMAIDPATGQKTALRLFDLWFAQARKRLPAGWKGIIKSDGMMVNNAGVLDVVMGSLYYLFGVDMGPVKGFTHLDQELAQAISAAVNGDGKTPANFFFYSDSETGGAITRLRWINPFALKDPKKLSALWNSPQIDQERVLQRLPNTSAPAELLRLALPELYERLARLEAAARPADEATAALVLAFDESLTKNPSASKDLELNLRSLALLLAVAETPGARQEAARTWLKARYAFLVNHRQDELKEVEAEEMLSRIGPLFLEPFDATLRELENAPRPLDKKAARRILDFDRKLSYVAGDLDLHIIVRGDIDLNLRSMTLLLPIVQDDELGEEAASLLLQRSSFLREHAQSNLRGAQVRRLQERVRELVISPRKRQLDELAAAGKAWDDAILGKVVDLDRWMTANSMSEIDAKLDSRSLQLLLDSAGRAQAADMKRAVVWQLGERYRLLHRREAEPAAQASLLDLLVAFSSDPDPDVRWASVDAINETRKGRDGRDDGEAQNSPAVVAALLARAFDPEHRVSQEAAKVLIDRTAEEAIVQVLKEPRGEAILDAASARSGDVQSGMLARLVVRHGILTAPANRLVARHASNDLSYVDHLRKLPQSDLEVFRIAAETYVQNRGYNVLLPLLSSLEFNDPQITETVAGRFDWPEASRNEGDYLLKFFENNLPRTATAQTKVVLGLLKPWGEILKKAEADPRVRGYEDVELIGWHVDAVFGLLEAVGVADPGVQGALRQLLLENPVLWRRAKWRAPKLAEPFAAAVAEAEARRAPQPRPPAPKPAPSAPASAESQLNRMFDRTLNEIVAALKRLEESDRRFFQTANQVLDRLTEK